MRNFIVIFGMMILAFSVKAQNVNYVNVTKGMVNPIVGRSMEKSTVPIKADLGFLKQRKATTNYLAGLAFMTEMECAEDFDIIWVITNAGDTVALTGASGATGTKQIWSAIGMELPLKTVANASGTIMKLLPI